MKQRKGLKIAAFLAALVLLFGLVWLVDSFTGYPFSTFRVRRAARSYLEAQYPGSNLVMETPERQLKLGGFTVEVTDPADPDGHFSLHLWTDGTLCYDTYEQDVLGGWNLLHRLDGEYRRGCTAAIGGHSFPWTVQGSGDLTTAAQDGRGVPSNAPGTRPEPLDPASLVGTEPDLADLAARYGVLTLIVETEDLSEATAARALLEAKAAMEAQGLSFCCAEVWVEPPAEDGPDSRSLHVRDFGWDDIYEDGMTQRVEQSIREAAAYYL